MREPRRRRLTRPLVALVAGLALGSVVVSSAAGLGGLRTQDLGGAAASVQMLDGVALSWSPQWHDGRWRVGELDLTADASRGFLADDEVRVTIADAQTCEISTDVTAATAAIMLDGDTLTEACGELPALTGTTAVALSVSGADGRTVVSDLGDLTGSVAGFAGPVTATAAATANRSAGVVDSVVVDVPGSAPADLDGARVAIALTASSGDETLTNTVSTAVAGPNGARVSIDVSDQAWATDTDLQIDVAISLPQALSGVVGGTAGVALAQTRLDASTTNPGGPGGNEPDDPDDTGDGGTTTPPATGGNGLVPVTVSPGIAYSYQTPWTGVQNNNLAFCHAFTVTNTTSRTLGDWTVQLNSKLAPMWGMNPTAPGTVSLSNIETRSYDAATGYWTVGGSSSWARQLEPGGSRTMQFCATTVPTPTPNPSLYQAEVSVVAQSDYYVMFRVRVTSTSEFYVPWRAEIDLAAFVCGTSLSNHPVVFNQVTATPVAGSTTRYVIQGTAGDTQLVSASHSRDFVFASYSPGAGWQSPCGQR